MKLKETVYFRVYGKRYHVLDCPYIHKEDMYYVSTYFMEVIESMKLLPCKKCKPVLR